MELNELFRTVETSEEEDWFALPAPPVALWEHSRGPGDRWELVPTYYITAHAHRGDIEIVLAWGARPEMDRDRSLKDEVWVREGHFPDPEAPPTEVVLRYRGESIRSWNFVYLDGSRYLVPIPRPTVEDGKVTNYVTERESQPIGNLVWGLFHGSSSPYSNLKEFMESCKVRWE